MNKRKFSTAPLPFMGQKRRFVADFRTALKTFDQATVFVDLFGGSGLLAHTAKQERPDARVIFNDFDNYTRRLENADQTNRLISDIREIVADAAKDKMLPPLVKEAVLQRVYTEEQRGFVDYITLSSSLLFSMNYTTNYDQFSKATIYNRVRKESYCCEGYLAGVEREQCDYRALFNRYRNVKGVVFFIDPPYLSTEVSVYENYWRLSDYLDVLHTLKGTSYFYFTSNKSSIVELLEWAERNLGATNPFAGATKKEICSRPNYHASHTDIMLYKQAG